MDFFYPPIFPYLCSRGKMSAPCQKVVFQRKKRQGQKWWEKLKMSAHRWAVTSRALKTGSTSIKWRVLISNSKQMSDCALKLCCLYFLASSFPGKRWQCSCCCKGIFFVIGEFVILLTIPAPTSLSPWDWTDLCSHCPICQLCFPIPGGFDASILTLYS